MRERSVISVTFEIFSNILVIWSSEIILEKHLQNIWHIFIVFIKDEFITFDNFVEKNGGTVPETSIINNIFTPFLAALSRFLQKFWYFLYSNISSWDLVFKKSSRNYGPFIICLCNCFVIKGALFARRYFCLIGACLSNMLNIVSLTLLTSN